MRMPFKTLSRWVYTQKFSEIAISQFLTATVVTAVSIAGCKPVAGVVLCGFFSIWMLFALKIIADYWETIFKCVFLNEQFGIVVKP